MMNQLNILLLALGGLQGGILGVYFVRKQKRNAATIYFVLILLVVGLQLTFKVISKLWLMQNYRLPYSLSYHLPYLIGPLMYLYFKALAGAKFKVTDLLHFLIFVFMLLNVTLQFYSHGDLRLFPLTAYANAAIQIVSICIYGFLSLRLAGDLLKELKYFLIGLVISEIIICITIALMYQYYNRFPDVRLLFILLTFFIYWISFKTMDSPQLFVAGRSSPLLRVNFTSLPKYNNSGLKESDAGRIAALLHHAMHQQKIFLDSGLTIEILSRQLHVSRHHLSQVLNERFGKTYTEYINDFRLAEAKARLQDVKFKHITVSAIAYDCGFNSVSNFNELFKKKFDQTPSQCRSRADGKMTA